MSGEVPVLIRGLIITGAIIVLICVLIGFLH